MFGSCMVVLTIESGNKIVSYYHLNETLQKMIFCRATCGSERIKVDWYLFLQVSGKLRSQKTETQVGNMQFLHTYITFIRLSKTVERNLLMAESMKSSLPATLQLHSVEEGTSPEAGPSGRKTAKPEDLVRIYDTILQVGT